MGLKPVENLFPLFFYTSAEMRLDLSASVRRRLSRGATGKWLIGIARIEPRAESPAKTCRTELVLFENYS